LLSSVSRNFWVIDVVQRCIVQPSEDVRYFALIGVAKDTIVSLSRPWGLMSFWDELSATIRDSIKLTQKYGERYLWIDSLCIIQDALEDKSQVIDMMGSIYISAILVICAADDRWDQI
jgi:hypothetical protein